MKPRIHIEKPTMRLSIALSDLPNVFQREYDGEEPLHVDREGQNHRAGARSVQEAEHLRFAHVDLCKFQFQTIFNVLSSPALLGP